MAETRLIDLKGAWLEVASMAMDQDIDPQLIADTLESIEGEIEAKAEGYVAVIRNLQAEKAAVAARKEYVKGILQELTAMEKHLVSREEWLKENLKETMIAIGQEKIKTDTLSLNVRKAGGKEKLDKTGEVPDNFKRVIYEDDDDKIREYLKDHTCDWARLLPRTTYLEIKGV